MNKMRDDQDFNIHFVKIIQSERSLYDKSLPEYRSKEEHEKIWQKISGQVNESGEYQFKIHYCVTYQCGLLKCNQSIKSNPIQSTHGIN